MHLLICSSKLFSIFLFLVLPIGWILIHRWGQRNNKGPKTWPIFGASIELFNNYHRMHDWVLEYLSESKTITVTIPFARYIYTADPANVEHILKNNFSNYPKGEFFKSRLDVLLGDGIFNADGELWRRQRKTASLEFASRNLRDLSTVVFREYSLKLSTMLCQLSCIDHQTVDMQDLFMRMTLDSICKVGFGVEIRTLSSTLPDNSFAHALDTASMIVTHRFIDPLWKLKRFFSLGSEAMLKKCIKIVDEFTYNVIRRRKEHIMMMSQDTNFKEDQIHHDILSRFIKLGCDDRDSDFSTEKSLRDVVLNFVLAGRDTTAVTLSWFIYMIITQPRVAKKLHSELKAFEEMRAEEEDIDLVSYTSDDMQSFRSRLLQFAGVLDYDSLGRLNYLHASITETVRLYPAVPQDLKGALKDDVFPDGTRVRGGEMVQYIPYSMGRTEYNWGHDALIFRPERWLNDDLIFQNVASPFKFSAFQAGPRICLGKDSAYLQMKMTLAILCRFFHFTLAPDHPPVQYKMMPVLFMLHGLHTIVSPRLP